MPPLHHVRFALSLLLSLGLTGCDLLGLGGPGETTLQGVVVSAETGAPVAGVDVVLASGCSWGFCTALDGMRTGATGEFRVAYETEDDGSSLLLLVNYDDCPAGFQCSYPYRWNPGWVRHLDNIPRGQRASGVRIELQRAP